MSAPTVYCYHQFTGEFTGSQPARLSPAWSEADPPGEQYLLPAWATFTAPSTPPEGSVSVFTNGSWGSKEDHRGSVWYDADGKPVTISALGPIPEGYTETPPPEAPADE